MLRSVDHELNLGTLSVKEIIMNFALTFYCFISFKKGCFQLQAKVCAQSTGKLLVQACPGKSVIR